jgi:translation initiation factor 3 subunit C
MNKKDKFLHELYNKDPKEISWNWINKMFKIFVAAHGMKGNYTV